MRKHALCGVKMVSECLGIFHFYSGEEFVIMGVSGEIYRNIVADCRKILIIRRMIYMPETIHNIIYQFSQQLKIILGNHLSKVIVYGSYARGDYQAYSDVDVMILVDLTEEEIKKIENEIYDLAFDIEMSSGIDISPVIKNEQQYEYWVDTLPFYRNVREEGVVIGG